MLQKLQNSLTRIYQNGTSIPSTLLAQIKEQLSTSSGQEGLVSKFNVCEFDGLDNPLSIDRNAQLFAETASSTFPLRRTTRAAPETCATSRRSVRASWTGLKMSLPWTSL